MDGSGLGEGDFAGICALQGCYGFIGITRREGGLYLSVRTVTAGESSMKPLGANEGQDREQAFVPLEDHFTGCRFGLAVYSTKEPGGWAAFRNFIYQER